MFPKLFKPSPYNKNNLPEHLRAIPEHGAYVFVVWSSAESLNALPALKDFLFQTLKPETNESVTVWLREPAIKSFTLKDRQSGDKGQVIAAMIRIRNMEKEKALALNAAIKEKGFKVKGFVVKNSVPLDSTQQASSTEPTSGLVSVSFFKAKKGLSKEAFWDYWFNAHTPFALDIHPLCKYERNRVLSALEDNAAAFDAPAFDAPVFNAIVPLHLERDEDLKFSTFFTHDGGSALANALRIYNDVKQFIDMAAIETVAMREYVLSQ